MENPWINIDLLNYEAHMASENVLQLQFLNRITKEQLRYKKPFVALLGAAGGNGITHIDPASVEKIYALDINRNFLEACAARCTFLKGRLETIACDLADPDFIMPFANLWICNLIIEYLGLEAFTALVKRNLRNVDIISCVIQKDNGASFVSPSKNAEKLSILSAYHHAVDEGELTANLFRAGLVRLLRKRYPLPEGKEFIRADYAKR